MHLISQCNLHIDIFILEHFFTQYHYCQIVIYGHMMVLVNIHPYYQYHYIDAIMATMASQITSLTIVYSTVYSDADQRKHQSSASLAFVWGIHRDRWIPRTKDQLRGKVSIWWRHNDVNMMASSNGNIFRVTGLFVRGIHRSPVNSPHIGQWRGALMFSLIWAWINAWVNNREDGDLRRHRVHYDVTVMSLYIRPTRKIIFDITVKQILHL